MITIPTKKKWLEVDKLIERVDNRNKVKGKPQFFSHLEEYVYHHFTKKPNKD
jgi:hypothetical protein